MRALLLAAGIGSRLGELTKETPKCLVSIDNTPMLKFWMDKIQTEIETQDILINTHHLSEKIDKYMVENYAPEIFFGNVRAFYEPTLLGSAKTLFFNRSKYIEKREEDLIVIYSDVWTEFNLKKIITWHKFTQSEITLGVYKTKNYYECGMVGIGERNTILSIDEKPEETEREYAFAGIAIFKTTTLCWLDNKMIDIAKDFLPVLINDVHREVKAYFIDEPLFDMGTPEGYKQACEEASK